MKDKFTLILASTSPRRQELLKQINILPNLIISPDIDENALKGEKPKDLALRLSKSKAQVVYEKNPEHFVLAADSVVACGSQILDKAQDADQAKTYLEKLSGRRHHVHGGICLITPQGRVYSRQCQTLVQFKLLSAREITDYLESKEWQGKAGGYAIQGYAGSFVKFLSGSYNNVVGLSLYDTIKILESAGIKSSK